MRHAQSTVVRWGLLAFSFAALEGATKVKNGKAHGRELQGKGTSSIMLTHFSPKHLTTCFSARAHRIPVHPFGPDFSALTPLHRLVNADQHGPPGRKERHQQPEQYPCASQARPVRPAEARDDTSRSASRP